MHTRSQEEFYLFPGGGLEPGETIDEGVEREFFEETGLKVKAKKMVYVPETKSIEQYSSARTEFDLFVAA